MRRSILLASARRVPGVPGSREPTADRRAPAVAAAAAGSAAVTPAAPPIARKLRRFIGCLLGRRKPLRSGPTLGSPERNISEMRSEDDLKLSVLDIAVNRPWCNNVVESFRADDEPPAPLGAFG